MVTPKSKTITELRGSLFETFEQVAGGKTQIITHKNGQQVAMISLEAINRMEGEIELHKNLAIGYAQAMRGEGSTTPELKQKLKAKEQALREKYG